MVPELEAYELNPPNPVRHASTPKQKANNNAPKRSIAALVLSEQPAVKKSTMIFPRLAWHQGINMAIAAPVAAPESSKSPVIALPNNSRPTMLAQVITVMKVSKMPARTAEILASKTMVRINSLFLWVKLTQIKISVSH